MKIVVDLLKLIIGLLILPYMITALAIGISYVFEIIKGEI